MQKLLIICLIAVSLSACDHQRAQNNVHDSISGIAVADTAVNGKFPPGPIPNTTLTAEYVSMVSNLAYLWAWPMVNLHTRKVTFEKVPQAFYKGGIVPIAPPNHLCMLTDYIQPQEREVACPNQDVAYGFGPFDFEKDAVVIQVPDFGDRFWVYQVCDQRTDGFANLGKMYGTKPGFYLLTGPGWNGKVPEGISGVFKSTTRCGAAIPRVFLSDDPADKQAAQSIINQITMYPLSDYDGKMKITEWTKIPRTPEEKTNQAGETQWVNPAIFFDQLPEIMKEVPPLPGEEALYGQIMSLLDGIAKNPAMREVANRAVMEANDKLIAPIFQFVNVGYPLKYNWTTQSNGAEFGVDYLTRTACAKANIFVNKPIETKYFYQDLDSSGARLNGNNKYTLTFAKGEVPPVKGFWSLTLYDQHHFFAPNELHRYSLGTKNKDLQLNTDGSLTLYVQSVAPEKSKMSNWLPAPKDQFSLYVRCYWPDERILDGGWIPPAVIKVK
jgi:hypothetical protein